VAYKDLREFIAALETQGELKRIRIPVSPILEITEITDRISKANGPALLFEQVEGASAPVLINAFGSLRRMCLALQVESLDEVVERIQALMEFKTPAGLAEKIRMLPRLADLAGFFPKTVRRGACQEVVREKDFSLLDFPVLKCWPDDGGRFITLPLVFTKDPVTGKRNCGMYRLQVYDETSTGMHWQLHKHGAHHFRKGRDGRERLEVAVAVGADPVVTFAATLPLPDDFDEMLFAGFLRGSAVEMVPCRTVDLEVPASAEIVLEGYVEYGETRTEGPFGDHTGFYSLADEYPVFRVQCVTHRREPVYHTTIVGRPPMEDCWIGKAIERILLPVMRKQFPEIVDVHLPFEGVFHNLMMVAIRKSYPGHARKVMHGIWGLGQAMFSKCIVVMDHDADIQNLGEAAWLALNNIDPQRDMEFVMGPVDSLDHASRLPNYGSKVGIDATRKWPEEGFARPWPEILEMSPEIRALVDGKWKDYWK
jgi:4-hydroxy-3-polyprenylbenzoate decarboxylase